MDEVQGALKVAKSKLEGFDTLIDLFDMTFVYITEEAAALSGYTPKELLGKQISQFMAVPHKTASFRQTIMKTLIGGRVEIPIRTKDGKEKIVNMVHTVVEVNGHPFLATRAVN